MARLAQFPQITANLHARVRLGRLLGPDPHRDAGQVVAQPRGPHKRRDGLANGIREQGGLQPGVRLNMRGEPLYPEQLSNSIARFRDSVREEKQHVAGFERRRNLVEDLAFADSQRQAVAVQDLAPPGNSMPMSDSGLELL